WYKQYFGASICTSENCKSEADPDLDGLTNQQEYYYHSDPMKDHTVGDKMNDGELVAHGFVPSKSGQITFAQASSDDNIVGESLFFNDDIKNEIQSSNDISQVTTPLIPDAQLKIVGDSQSSFQEYDKQVNDKINKYFPSSNI